MGKIQTPYDVAFMTSENDSFIIIFLFNKPNDAGLFFHGFLKDKDFNIEVSKSIEGKFSFSLSSSNSPDIITIHTNRTESNNESIKKVLDPNYKDYTYLSCGVKNMKTNEISCLNDKIPAFK